MNRVIAVLIFCCSFACDVVAQIKPLPGPVGYVSDYDNIFYEAEEQTLDSIVRAFEKETTVEIAIVTFDSTWAPVHQFDSLVLAIHNQWGIGKKVKNNGILIGICLPFRKIRISNGYGIEPVISDAVTKEILDKFILPEFRKGAYFEGTRKGLQAIIQVLRRNYNEKAGGTKGG